MPAAAMPVRKERGSTRRREGDGSFAHSQPDRVSARSLPSGTSATPRLPPATISSDGAALRRSASQGEAPDRRGGAKSDGRCGTATAAAARAAYPFHAVPPVNR